MNIAIIPARGGSKRIPKKNIKAFAGKPIIAYSIEAALKSGCFDKVVVSTDDEVIAQKAIEYGAEVPFIRPNDLSGDTVGTMPVVSHTLKHFEQHQNFAFCCLIYATAPLLCPQDIKNAYQQLQELQSEYVFGVTSYASPIQRALKLDANNKVSMFQPNYLYKRSQDLEPAYHDAAQFYWGKTQAFLEEKPVFAPYSTAYVIERHRVQDIDDHEDWKIAEQLYILNQNT